MSLFDISPWIVKKKDGTKKQVFPQTSIKGVIGLEKELTSIKAVVENLTGKKFDKNYQNNFLTKKDLEDYVTTNQLTQSTTNSKAYADSIVATLKESLPTFNQQLLDTDDLNNFKKNGTYYRKYSDTILKNAPTNDTDSKVGTLIVLNSGNGQTDITQIFITTVDNSKVYIRGLSGVPATWSEWRILSDPKELSK
ncbi:pyocin knob domain-containing protein [Fructilactobacillus lindneri]|uniref:Uncharacterized protein n=1 Tax=Fructilactobacillus lindneri DSM 20690 = JCM 11027 TaxID=1122148 RepID=A0A0R2JU59_9LACO|nr:pyocin knob domain-containing protein [Fructilactobacillus lindneri]KRN80655.1 hypothetical protein IV52_GL001210 [Fructilactobacillus lindneri DSM 20690 = JCM 11027]POH07509.1 hypothetical protein BGL35_00070 [Fructilactobacillus lindneri]POH08582.1 hypothetical protein BGL36_00105 [Fructilactobacillus lindneri]POH24904.1 hypothetical protein BHU33_02655 [Fructilactobacillus lindneri DSM 20690 = JCM 11027]SKA08920.1 hypothetical protein SAMN02746042_01445 [Fructilactobacillus lindneri DSM 